jgi:hypothetical protein
MLALLAVAAFAWIGPVSDADAARQRDVSRAHDSRLAAGIWADRSSLARLDTTGTAWQALRKEAAGDCGRVDLSDQRSSANVCVLAKALVFARTGAVAYRDDVRGAAAEIVAAPAYHGRALAMGRELAAYVIAADIVQLRDLDAPLDALFRAKLVELRSAPTYGGGVANLVECHEKRPNNWGTHCGASRVAVAAYLGDDEDLARAATVFKGFLGDRSAYADFRYGDDLSWQCDPGRPVGINPVRCSRDGLSLDGVIPDDQRRGGAFTTSPPHENYVWEALQGALVQAVILERAGYPTFEWEDRALLRAVEWLYDQNAYPAEGDDTWQVYVINRAYGSHFPIAEAARPGKNVGWTDWTHAPSEFDATGRRQP